MFYTDLHCDTLTHAKKPGERMYNNRLQADFLRLKAAGCAAQCFAVFLRGGTSADFYEYVRLFNEQVAENSAVCAPVLSCADLKAAMAAGKLGCILTAENIGFVRSGEEAALLRSAGVRMASLVWNDENALAYPNLKYAGGAPDFSAREGRGLKPLGREVAAALDGAGIIIDVSHLSDGGLDELLRGRKIPLVASHSDACELHSVSRNLTDGQIKGIAGCGGVAGVNFCNDFLGGDDAMESAVRHIAHIINTGGEDCAAIGSDFDGMPPQRGMESCARMPEFLEKLSARFGSRVAEKVACKNFMRVFGAVCG